MKLGVSITGLRDGSLAEIEDLDWFWRDSGAAWELVVKAASAPTSATVGAGVDDGRRDVAELASRSEYYHQQYLNAAVVQRLHAAVDGFLLGLIGRWLTAFPKNLLRTGRGQKSRDVPLAEVLAAPDRAAVIDRVVERELRRLAYRSLTEQLGMLETLVGLDRPDVDERNRLAELKATRDTLVHGRGLVGPDYVGQSGQFARFVEGHRIQLPDEYLSASFRLVRTLVESLGTAAAAKAGDAPARG